MIDDLDQLDRDDIGELGTYPTDERLPALTPQEQAEVAERNKHIVNLGIGHQLGIA